MAFSRLNPLTPWLKVSFQRQPWGDNGFDFDSSIMFFVKQQNIVCDISLKLMQFEPFSEQNSINLKIENAKVGF